MINTWWFNLIAFLFFYIIFTQLFKVVTSESKNDGALTVLLQLLGGLTCLLLMPFFKIQFPTDYRVYLMFAVACTFYAIADRVNTPARRGLDVSTYSILYQLETVFIVILGIVFFKEKIIIKQLIGGLLILFGNVLVLYQKGKLTWNKYVLFGIIGNLALSFGVTIDVGISEQFNLPFYVMISLSLPALLIIIIERIKIKDVIAEWKNGKVKTIPIVGASWALQIISMLRAYQFGSVTTIAPLCALTTILNVFVAYFALNEKTSIVKKVIAAVIVVGGIVLIKI